MNKVEMKKELISDMGSYIDKLNEYLKKALTYSLDMDSYGQSPREYLFKEGTNTMGYNVAGVYYIYENEKLIYIGESNDIRKRLREHLYNSRNREKYFLKNKKLENIKIKYIETEAEDLHLRRVIEELSYVALVKGDNSLYSYASR